METLRSCPFCGSKAEAFIGVAPEDWVQCSLCGARSRFSYGHAVIEAWNTRHVDSLPTEEEMVIKLRGMGWTFADRLPITMIMKDAIRIIKSRLAGKEE